MKTKLAAGFVAIAGLLAVPALALDRLETEQDWKNLHSRSFSLLTDSADSTAQDAYNLAGTKLLEEAAVALQNFGQDIFGKGLRLNSDLTWTGENDIRGAMHLGVPLWTQSDKSKTTALLMQTGLSLSENTDILGTTIDQTDVNMGLVLRQQRGDKVFGLGAHYHTNTQTDLGQVAVNLDMQSKLFNVGVGGYFATENDWVEQDGLEYRIASGVDMHGSYTPASNLRVSASFGAWEDLNAPTTDAYRFGAQVQGHWDFHPSFSLSAGYAYDMHGIAEEDATVGLQFRYPPVAAQAAVGNALNTDIFSLGMYGKGRGVQGTDGAFNLKVRNTMQSLIKSQIENTKRYYGEQSINGGGLTVSVAVTKANGVAAKTKKSGQMSYKVQQGRTVTLTATYTGEAEGYLNMVVARVPFPYSVAYAPCLVTGKKTCTYTFTLPEEAGNEFGGYDITARFHSTSRDAAVKRAEFREVNTSIVSTPKKAKKKVRTAYKGECNIAAGAC